MQGRVLSFQPPLSQQTCSESSAVLSSLHPQTQEKLMKQISRFVFLASVNPRLADEVLECGEQLLRSYGV